MIGYCEYNLALLEIQKSKFNEAIDRLENIITPQNVEFEDLLSRAQYQIGRTHLYFLNDRETAKQHLNAVKEDYPDSQIAKTSLIRKLNTQ